MEELAGFGARIHTCSRNETELNKCLNEWKLKGFRVSGSVCDVTSRPARENLIQTVSSEFNGKLNILVSFILISSSVRHFALKLTKPLLTELIWLKLDKQCRG